jgi:hypothetical protein
MSVLNNIFNKLDLKSKEKDFIDVVNSAPWGDLQDMLLLVQEWLDDATTMRSLDTDEFKVLTHLDELREKLFASMYARDKNRSASLMLEIKKILTTNSDVFTNGTNECGEILLRMNQVREERKHKRNAILALIVVSAVNFVLAFLGNYAASFL